MKIIYSAACTLCALMGAFALVAEDYDFAILCLAIALAPLVLIAIFRNMKTSLVGNDRKPRKSPRKQSTRKQSTRKNSSYKSTRKKNSNTIRVKNNGSKTRRKKDEYDNFYDVTDAWNSI